MSEPRKPDHTLVLQGRRGVRHKFELFLGRQFPKAEFQAQQQYDRDWARRTATLMFMRHRNVRVIALSQRSWIDATYPDRGHTEAQVALTGAEALLPQQAGHYQVRLEWRQENGSWQLARLQWQ